MYSNSTSSSVLRDKQGNNLFSWHSLDNVYWVNLFGINPNNNPTWDINDPITTEEI